MCPKERSSLTRMTGAGDGIADFIQLGSDLENQEIEVTAPFKYTNYSFVVELP